MDELEDVNVQLMRLFGQVSHMQLQQLSRFRGQGRLLILLSEFGTMSQKRLAEITQRKPATVSEQLDRMEEAGWIIRKKNEWDRRNTDVQLTERGRIATREAQEERRRAAECLFGALNEAERAELCRLLNKLADAYRGTGEHTEEEEHGNKA